MKQYKRRTIALVLASVITVIGAFGVENYKNSIMSMDFETAPSGAVNMTINTKLEYKNNITATKKDANTYVIMLSETNSLMDQSPKISGNVESVDIRTMPYTTSNNGYTKITVKTAPNTMLTAKKALYIPKEQPEQPAIEQKQPDNEQNMQQNPIPQTTIRPEVQRNNPSANYNKYPENKPSPPKEVQKNTQRNYVENRNIVPQNPPNAVSQPMDTAVQNNNTANNYESESSTGMLYAILSVLLLLIVITYLYIRGKNKMTEILGEQTDFDIDDSQEQKEKKENKVKKQKIKKTINTLDKMYKKPVTMPVKSLDEQTITHGTGEKIIKEDSNIVDLDELFQEQNNSMENEQENSDLDDFLNSFLSSDDSGNEQEMQNIIAEQEKYNEELFNKFINDDTIHFSKDDMEKIDKLLNIEFTDELIKNIDKYVTKAPIIPDKSAILDKWVTELAVSQNITFTHEDIDALDKLLNVELDKSFVTDLRTDAKRTQEMTWEILNRDNKRHNTREILTMRVKDALPNLAEELKKHKKIESNAKPETIYYEDGYDVATFSVDEMPDLGIEINNKANKVTRPSDDIIWQDEWSQNYDAPVINVSELLPDLADVKKHPKKYEDKPVSVKVDEKALERNLEGVVFKPFYDGEETNKIFNEDTLLENLKEENVIPIEEVGIIDNINNVDFGVTDINTDDIEVTADDIENIDIEGEINITPPERVKKPRPVDEKTQELLQTIKNKKENKDTSKIVAKEQEPEQEQVSQTETKVKTTCMLDGIEYDILASSTFTDSVGCYLATSKEEGYSILGYMGDKIFKIKHYEKIQSHKLQGRMSEKLDDGTLRYIVRIGIHKFVLNVSDDNMEYVMDLC